MFPCDALAGRVLKQQPAATDTRPAQPTANGVGTAETASEAAPAAGGSVQSAAADSGEAAATTPAADASPVDGGNGKDGRGAGGRSRGRGGHGRGRAASKADGGGHGQPAANGTDTAAAKQLQDVKEQESSPSPEAQPGINPAAAAPKQRESSPACKLTRFERMSAEPSPKASSPARPEDAPEVAAAAAAPSDTATAADAAAADAAGAAEAVAAAIAAAAEPAVEAAAAEEDSEAAGFSGASDLSGAGGGVAAAVDAAAGSVDGAAFMSKLQVCTFASNLACSQPLCAHIQGLPVLVYSTAHCVLGHPNRHVVRFPWQERMQEVRAARHAGGSSPQKAAPLLSPRPSQGRRMSQAGGLAATGNPRVRQQTAASHLTALPGAVPEGLSSAGCCLDLPEHLSCTDFGTATPRIVTSGVCAADGDLGAAGVALRPDRGAAVHRPLEAAGGVPAAEQDHRAGRAQGDAWRQSVVECCSGLLLPLWALF